MRTKSDREGQRVIERDGEESEREREIINKKKSKHMNSEYPVLAIPNSYV